MLVAVLRVGKGWSSARLAQVSGSAAMRALMPMGGRSGIAWGRVIVAAAFAGQGGFVYGQRS